MLKTVPFEIYEDAILLKYNKGEDIESLRKIYNPQIIEEGVVQSNLNFKNNASNTAKVISSAMFVYKKDKLKKIVDRKDIDLKRYMKMIRKNDLILEAYGVCDNVEQIKELYKLDDPEEKFTISLTPIYRNHQPEEGGWRWSKWGKYIGEQKSNAEYIFEESNIEMIYVFHIYPWDYNRVEHLS